MDYPILSYKFVNPPNLRSEYWLYCMYYIDFLFYLYFHPSCLRRHSCTICPLGLQAFSEQRSLQSRDCVKRGMRQERGKPSRDCVKRGILKLVSTLFEQHHALILLWSSLIQGYSIELLKVTTWSTPLINLIEPKYAPFPKYALLMKRQDLGSRNRLFWKTFRKRGHRRGRWFVWDMESINYIPAPSK